MSGLAIASTAFANAGATPEVASNSITKGQSPLNRAAQNQPIGLADASELRTGADADRVVERFGFRAPYLPGTVCTTEAPDTCFDWDLSSTGFVAPIVTGAFTDSIYLVRNDFTQGPVEVSQICIGAIYQVNGSFTPNDPMNPFPTNWRVTFYEADTSVPGQTTPDEANPVVNATFVEGTPGAGEQNFTSINYTYNTIPFPGFNQAFFDVVHFTFPAVTLQSETCYWLSFLNATDPAEVVTFAPVPGVLVDGGSFWDSNANGIFETGEFFAGDIGWCIYGADIPDPVDPETDYFLDFGDPNIGAGGCYANLCPPEAFNTSIATAEQLTADGTVIPSNGICNLGLGDGANDAATCPILFADNSLALDLGNKYALWWYAVGDGTTFTLTTDFLNDEGVLPDTLISIYCNGLDTPASLNTDRLYCLASDDDGAGVDNGPAEISWPTEAGEVYYIVVFQSDLNEFSVALSSDGVAGACTVGFDCSPLVLDCPDGSITDEVTDEPCDDTLVGVNNGCNAATPALPSGMSNGTFQPITPGTVHCGTANRVGGTRDTDWYYLNIAQNSVVTWSMLSEFENQVLVISLNNKSDGAGGTDPTGCTSLTILNTDVVANGERGIVNDVAISLPPGEYAFWAGPATGVGYEYPCTSGENDYQVLVTVDPVATLPAGGTIENGTQKCTTSFSAFSNPNQGCTLSDTAGVAATLASGNAYRGQSGIAQNQTPDADAWRFTLASTQLVTFDFQSQFPAQLWIIEKVGGVCENFLRFSSERFQFDAGTNGQLQVVLGAGDYQFIVLPEDADDPLSYVQFECTRTFSNQYYFEYTTQALCTINTAGSIAENENWCASQTSTNSGCAAPADGCSSSPGFTGAPTLSIGDTGSGTIGATSNTSTGTFTRDIDSWPFTLASQQTVTVDVDANFPAIVQILDVADCDNVTVVDAFITSGCTPGSLELVDLAAGSYAVLVTTDFGVIDCGDSQGTYTVTLGGGTAPGCGPADTTTTGTSNGIPDGVVDISDYSFYLTLWGAGNLAADVTTTGTSNGIPDGVVDISDFSYYLTLWGAGCP